MFEKRLFYVLAALLCSRAGFDSQFRRTLLTNRYHCGPTS